MPPPVWNASSSPRLRELHRLELGKRVHLHRLAGAEYPRRRGVVVERAFE
jgi:hypothetical protein